MNVLENIVQGSREWLEIRRLYDTASEAPAALGKSKYMARTALLSQKSTGMAEEVDGFKQALFDKGHAAEDSARPIAERIAGSDLYPVTATLEIDGLKLLASFDGCTLDNDILFEHKLWSENLAADIATGNLDPHYTIQMDQQLLVSGAKKCLFMTSDGTEEKMAWCWYESSQEKFDALIAGWKQFAADLADYQPKDLTEKPKADAILALPALAIQIRGEVASSNLPVFKESAERFIAAINTDLKTDQDFAVAEATVKFCKEAEENIELTKNAAIAQTASIDDMMRTLDHIQAQLRDKRLTLDKLVKSQKEVIKAGILNKAKVAFNEHIASLEAEIKPIRFEWTAISPDFAGAMKSKRTLASLHDAVDSELANAKIAADAVAKDMRTKLAWCKTNADGYGFLFPDLQQVIYKPMDDFQMLVNTRINEHKKAAAEKEEQDRKRIQEEERVKAEAKVREEQEAAAAVARQQAVLEAAQNRREEDSEQEMASQPSLEKQIPTAANCALPMEISKPSAMVGTPHSGGSYGYSRPIAKRPMVDSRPPITTGALCALAGDGLSITAAFIQTLGVSPAERPKESKSGTYWAAADVPVIFAALARHFEKLAVVDNAIAA